MANACDAGGSPGTLYTQVNCYGGYYYLIAPNPASSEVTVTAKETTPDSKAPTNGSITELNIYDQQGTLKKQKKYAPVKKATLNISDLKTGIYILEIINGSYKERQQLSVVK